MLEDTLRGGEDWLMDKGLEATATLGPLVAMRLAQPDDFAISCGVIFPSTPIDLRAWPSISCIQEFHQSLHGSQRIRACPASFIR